MAGDWIKVRANLREDPAVIAVAVRLDVDEDLVVGKLCRLWSWANAQTENGALPGVTTAWVDRFVGVPGFAEALRVVGWLVIRDDGITIPRFERHNSRSAKRRAADALRKQHARSASAQCPQDVRTASAKCPPQRREERTAESEFREEKKSDSAGAADASSEHEKCTDRRSGGPTLLGDVLRGEDAGAAAGERNVGPVILDIEQLLADRGCDVSFRRAVAKWGDIRVIHRLGEEFDRKRASIANAGGWWRDKLRRAGMKGI